MGVEPKMRFLSTFNDSELEIVQNTLQSVSCTHEPPCWCLSNQYSSYDSGRQVIPGQEESWGQNDKVIEDSARHSNHKSDILVCYSSWQISDFLNQNSNDTVREPFPIPVHFVHLLGQVDTELWLLELFNHHNYINRLW